nr:reverse transcriptase domain-containing protein [Tanacetum cinerariifolium]
MFLIVAMYYFTKWIEAKDVATISGSQVKKFVWDNIVCRFRLLGEIVTYNSKQFSDDPFKDWCEKAKYRTALRLMEAVHNDEELRLNLDRLEERHERAAIREAKAKLKMTKYYNARVRGGKDLDLSSLEDASSSVISACVATSASMMARPLGATVGTDTGTPSDLAWWAEPTPRTMDLSSCVPQDKPGFLVRKSWDEVHGSTEEHVRNT